GALFLFTRASMPARLRVRGRHRDIRIDHLGRGFERGHKGEIRMYHFSRSIYRELAPRIEARDGIEASAARNQLLESCEATIRRVATDRRYFARPARTLFGEVRELFALSEQVRVYIVIERYLGAAEEFLESLPDDITLDGQPRHCLASTRKGTPCQ